MPCLPTTQKAPKHRASPSPVGLLLMLVLERLLVAGCPSCRSLVTWAVTSSEHSHRNPKEMFCFSAACVTPNVSCILSDLLARTSQQHPGEQLLKFICAEIQGKLEPLQQHNGYRKAETLESSSTDKYSKFSLQGNKMTAFLALGFISHSSCMQNTGSYLPPGQGSSRLPTCRN